LNAVIYKKHTLQPKIHTNVKVKGWKKIYQACNSKARKGSYSQTKQILNKNQSEEINKVTTY
jgi:hypothetical protein